MSDNLAALQQDDYSVINVGESIPNRRLANLKPAWVAGESPNPAGRPVGARHKLSERYLMDTYADWLEHGAAALVRCREKDPVAYCRMVAGLLPKQSAHIRANVSQSIGGDVAREALLRAAAAMGLTLTDTHSVPVQAGGIENGEGGLERVGASSSVQEQPLPNNSVGVPKIPEVPVIFEVHEAGGQPSGTKVRI